MHDWNLHWWAEEDIIRQKEIPQILTIEDRRRQKELMKKEEKMKKREELK